MDALSPPDHAPVAGDADLVARVIEQMQSEQQGDWIKQAAKRAHIGIELFSLIRKLLMMKGWPEVSDDDKATINRALSHLRKREFREARCITNGVLQRHWRKGTRNGKHAIAKTPTGYAREYYFKTEKPKLQKERATKRQLKRIDATLFAIREACTNNDELEIPPISEDARREHLALIDLAIEGLVELRKRIRENLQ